jgi:hypothetical protein
MSKPEHFLSRWSRRKLEAVRAPAQPAPVAEAIPAPAPVPPAVEAPAAAPAAAASELPPVESLTFDSDFTAFLKPGVDRTLQRAALRKLLHDPRFNVMDGLDVYIDDYTKPSPLETSLIKDLVSARYVFSPPATRVNAEGVVEDVPPEEIEAEAVPEEPAQAGREEGAGDAS